ncbi:unnamed protein product [Mycena citricolor]|uniref:Integral membrane family protein n=1 Tax=Mycena citricolor TaxID=2018698 RepID=A0AAD2GUP2_9AGAR|nr:unnamed protein product [Mycena citricolor]
MRMPDISIVSITLPLLLAGHGFRKKSLSTSGALTALVVGFLMFVGSLKTWGISLILFYLIGSRATKYRKQKKRTLEAGYHDAGYRSGWQVLSNSFSALVACSAWNILFDPQGVHASIFRLLTGDAVRIPSSIVHPYSSEWCPVSENIGQGWSRTLVFAALGHFACCLGDTLASEIGILAPSPPRLITTWKPVPPGTNGGMSVNGTIASLVGGVIMGLVASICLVLENPTCRQTWDVVVGDAVFWGAIAGAYGSAIDSFLGATIQATRYDDERKVVTEDAAQGKTINGWNVLSNNQVNVVSSLCCAAFLGLYA